MRRRRSSCLMITGISAFLAFDIGMSGIAGAQEQRPDNEGADIRPKLVWAVDAITPGFIKVEGRVNGYGAQMLDWFIARMPGHDHLIEILPRRSAFDAMRMATETGETGETVCIPGLLRSPERERDFAMSRTVAPLLPLSVVVSRSARSSFRPYMADDGTIDLEALLGDTSRYTALAKSRSYGPQIDSILARAINAPNVLRTDNQSSFLSMLEMGRIDWMLAYPVEIEFRRRATNSIPDIVSLPISGMPELLDIGIACSRSQNGMVAVEKFDTILAAHPDMPWLEYYVEYLAPQDRDRFREALEHFKKSQMLPVGQ